jgi:hypothetical protein
MENSLMTSEHAQPRVLVIGLDGAKFILITPLMSQGLPPNLAGLGRLD